MVASEFLDPVLRAMLVSNWGNYPKVEAEVKESSEPWKRDWKGMEFIARGLGRSYGDASLFERILNMGSEKGIMDLAEEGTIWAKSGTSLLEIIQYSLPKGYFLPVTPGTKYVTLGGMIAADVHGKNHHIDGTISNFVEEIEIWTPEQGVINCSEDQNSELFNWTCGGMGLTGIIMSAKIRLRRIQTKWIKQQVLKSGSLTKLLDLFENHEKSTYSVAWLDSLASGSNFGRGILYLGEHASEDDVAEKMRGLTWAPKKKLNVPFHAPSFLLNSFSNRVFNQLYYSFSSERSLVDLDTFFYPLDKISNWNRAYGKRGFFQYQFVIPSQSGVQGVERVLRKLQKEGISSFLTVLKKLGRGRGYMSFPIDGYTLALDFPASRSAKNKLNKVDDMVHEMGGRVYLAKDARMEAAHLRVGYPEHAAFSSFVQPLPFNSNLAQRLKIK